MGAFEEFQGMVSAGLATLAEGHELIHAARAKYEVARQQVADVAGTSDNEKIESLRRNLEAVLWALDGALLARDAGLEEFDSYLAQVGATGSSVPQGGRGEVGAPIPEAVNPFRQELAGTDDGDPERKKIQRFGRALIRSTGDVKQQAHSWAKAGYSTKPPLDPGPTRTYMGTGHNRTDSIGPPPAKTIDPADVIGHTIILTAMTFEAFTRFARRKRENDG